MEKSAQPQSALDIKQESYFPFNFKLFGGILILGCFLVYIAQVAFIAKVLLIPILFLLGLITLTARYGLKIDVSDKTYAIYVWILGLKFGPAIPFQCIRQFYINEVTEKAVVTARSGLTSDVRNKVYKAYMKLDDDEKIHLDTDKNEQNLEKKLLKYQEILSELVCRD